MNYLEISKYAYSNCKFYKKNNLDPNMTKENFYNLPILNRKDILNNKFDIMSSEYANFSLNSFVSVSTSGSSGIPLIVYWNEQDYIKSNYYLWRLRKKFYNIVPKDKSIKFITDRFNSSQLFFIKMNTMNFYKEKISNVNFKEVIKIINEFSPKALYIQPSVLAFIVNNCIKHNLKLSDSIQYIETTGELLDDTLRCVLLKHYPKINIVNMYGTEELNGIAYECPYKNLHIIEENVFLETIEQDLDGYGKAIATSLHNKVFPLIRYNIGDIIKIDKKTCKCGQCGNVVEVLDGRIDDVFYEENLKISTYSLTAIIYNVNNNLDFPIYEYKFKYIKSIKKLEVYFVLNNDFQNWKERINCEFNKYFQKMIKIECDIEINYVDKIYTLDKKNKVLEVI